MKLHFEKGVPGGVWPGGLASGTPAAGEPKAVAGRRLARTERLESAERVEAIADELGSILGQRTTDS